MTEISRRIHFQQELPPLRLFFGTPWKFSVLRKNNTEPPLRPLLTTAQNVSTLSEDSRIWSESVFPIRNRKRILFARVNGIERRLCFERLNTGACVRPLHVGLPVWQFFR